MPQLKLNTLRLGYDIIKAHKLCYQRCQELLNDNREILENLTEFTQKYRARDIMLVLNYTYKHFEQLKRNYSGLLAIFDPKDEEETMPSPLLATSKQISIHTPSKRLMVPLIDAYIKRYPLAIAEMLKSYNELIDALMPLKQLEDFKAKLYSIYEIAPSYIASNQLAKLNAIVDEKKQAFTLLDGLTNAELRESPSYQTLIAELEQCFYSLGRTILIMSRNPARFEDTTRLAQGRAWPSAPSDTEEQRSLNSDARRLGFFHSDAVSVSLQQRTSRSSKAASVDFSLNDSSDDSSGFSFGLSSDSSI
jgi:hypothetical protein